MLYVGEGMNASVAVTETGSGVRNFHVSGKVEPRPNRRTLRPAKDAGASAGVASPEATLGARRRMWSGRHRRSFLAHPDIDKIVLCEIEPLIPNVAARYFGKENHDVVKNPRTEIIYDDARHYLLTTPEKFDIITSDPIHPWVKAPRHSKHRGILRVGQTALEPGRTGHAWVPLYERVIQAS